MKILFPKLGRLTNDHCDGPSELKRSSGKKRRKMMQLEAGCHQELKIATKTPPPTETKTPEIPDSTAEEIHTCPSVTSNCSSINSSINSRTADANTPTITTTYNNNNNHHHHNNYNSSVTSNNSNNNLKPMPRQRIPKLIQNDSSGEKNAQAGDVSKTSRSQEDRFQRNFPDLASCSDDMLIKTYHCALVTDILLQGYLYITSRWFCFYSKLFGKKKLIKIPLSLVLDVSKKKTAKFIPNAVGVTTLNKEYLFGSLLSRDNTYRVMCSAWHAYKSNSKENGSSPESEMSETNEELVSLDSHNTTANQSESTSYEESFSNVEEDIFESCDLKGRDEVTTSVDGERCRYEVEKSNRKKYKKSVYSLFEFAGYMLNMSSPSKTCMFLVVASILTAMLLVSAFLLSCQLSNLEVLFARIITKTSSTPTPQMVRGHNTVPGDQGLTRVDGDDDDLSRSHASEGDVDDEGGDCHTHKENLFLANLREISTMHHQLLGQINKILTALQRVTFNNTDQLHQQS